MRSIFTLPVAAARATNEQASGVRQHNEATKVRSPLRQPSNPAIEAKRKNPRSSHAATNRRTSGNRPARLQAAAPSGFRQLPMPGCISLAIFSPTTFDSSGDFLSAAAAALHRARSDSCADFFDGAPNEWRAGRMPASWRARCPAEREGWISSVRDSADACRNTRRCYIR